MAGGRRRGEALLRAGLAALLCVLRKCRPGLVEGSGESGPAGGSLRFPLLRDRGWVKAARRPRAWAEEVRAFPLA